MTITTPSTPNTFLGTVEADFKVWLGEAEALGEGLALNMWGLFKTLFGAFTTDQFQIALNVLNRLQVDALAGKSLEQIESDMLNEAVADELGELTKIGSNALQSIIALFKSKLSAVALPPVVPSTPAS